MKEYYAEDMREVRRTIQQFFDEHRLDYFVVVGIDFYSGHIYLKFMDAKGAEVNGEYIYKYYSNSLKSILPDSKLIPNNRIIQLLIVDNQILRDFNNSCYHNMNYWITPYMLELELL